MTPQELAEIEQYVMQMDPMGAAVNRFGPGAGYLQMEDEPLAWERMDDFDARLTDTLKLAQMYLPDLVDLPYQEVQDPGEYAGFQNYTASQYGSNPAHQLVQQAVNDPNDPMSYDEAVNRVLALAQDEGNPDAERLRAALPQDEEGNLDARAFRSDVQGSSFDAGREAAERGDYDAERAAFEDYTRTRSALDFRPVVDAPELATGFEPNANVVTSPGAAAGSLPNQIRNAVVNAGAGNASAGREYVDGRLVDIANTDVPEPAGGGYTQWAAPERLRTDIYQGSTGPSQARVERTGRGDIRTAQSRDVSRDTQGRSGTDVSFDQNRATNAVNKFAADVLRKNRGAQEVQSKERANQSAILQALAQLRYGGDL